MSTKRPCTLTQICSVCLSMYELLLDANSVTVLNLIRKYSDGNLAHYTKNEGDGFGHIYWINFFMENLIFVLWLLHGDIFGDSIIALFIHLMVLDIRRNLKPKKLAIIPWCPSIKNSWQLLFMKWNLLQSKVLVVGIHWTFKDDRFW